MAGDLGGITMRWLLVLSTVGVSLAALPAQAQSGMTPAERAELESLRQRMAQLEAQVAQRAQADAQHEAQQEAQRVEHEAQQAQHEAQQAERPVEAESDLDGNPEHGISVYGFAQIDAT